MKHVLLALLLVAGALVVAPAAEAAPDCSDIYNKFVLGPVTIIQRSSCEYEVCVEDVCSRLA